MNRLPQLPSIQILRAIAACAVMFAHAWPTLRVFGAQDSIPNFILGASGVDLFFVISGFIMVYSSEPLFGCRDAPRRFLGRRLLRIVPLYWIMTTLVLFGHHFKIPTNSSAAHVIGSYFFVPIATPGGTAEPLLGVGWTLNYEMFFYVIFAAFVALPRRAAVPLLTIVLIGISYMPGATTPPLSVWSSSFLYEFIFGAWIAMAMREGFRLPLWFAIPLAIGGLILMIVTDRYAFGLFSRVGGWGGGAACIVAAFALADANQPIPNLLRPMVMLGSASYALYLVHSLISYAMIYIGISGAIRPAQHPWVYCSAFFCLSIVAAFAINAIDERARRYFLSRLKALDSLGRSDRTPAAQHSLS
jgi:exopolysaccharide production protein ExoZ